MEATTTEIENWNAHIVETAWLADHLTSTTPPIRIVDMRGYVRLQTAEDGFQEAEYVGAPEEYHAAHIPGAVYLDWTRDIVDENDPVPAQAAGAEKIRRVLGNAGIDDSTLIIAYDSSPAAQFATRLWWLCRYYGNPNVRVLNGGWKRWQDEGRPTSTETPVYPPVHFTAIPQPEWRMTAKEVLESLNAPDTTLIDARDEGQYRGKIRRGRRGGHIPGAISLPREVFLAGPGEFRTPDEIREIVSNREIRPDSHIIAYCNGGVAATSVLFALSILGFPRLTNYDGSWNEWNQREDLPVTT